MIPATRYRATRRRGGFARQRMDKSGTFTAPQAQAYYKATGWVANATNPATISGDSLRVVGSGTVTMAWSFTGTGAIQIRRGATVLGSGASSAGVAVTVADGDLLDVYVQSNFFPQGTVTGGNLELY